MGKRVLLAGVLGGVAMFIWSSIAHTVLPLGTIGIKEIPDEQPVLTAMQTQLGGGSGFYFFPGMGMGEHPTRAQQNAAMQQYDQKLATNPSGILIYHPPGAKSVTPAKLATEFASEFLGALLLAFLLARANLPNFSARLGFVIAASILAAITTNVSYWNWYGFPSSYTISYMSTQVVGYIAAGIVAALILAKGSASGTKLAAAA